MGPLCIRAVRRSSARTANSKANSSQLQRGSMVSTKGLAVPVLGQGSSGRFAMKVLNPAPSKPFGVRGSARLAAVAGHQPISRAGTRGRYKTPEASCSSTGLPWTGRTYPTTLLSLLPGCRVAQTEDCGISWRSVCEEEK